MLDVFENIQILAEVWWTDQQQPKHFKMVSSYYFFLSVFQLWKLRFFPDGSEQTLILYVQKNFNLAEAWWQPGRYILYPWSQIH